MQFLYLLLIARGVKRKPSKNGKPILDKEFFNLGRSNLFGPAILFLKTLFDTSASPLLGCNCYTKHAVLKTRVNGTVFALPVRRA